MPRKTPERAITAPIPRIREDDKVSHNKLEWGVPFRFPFFGVLGFWILKERDDVEDTNPICFKLLDRQSLSQWLGGTTHPRM